ncbi:MAG: DUF2029 domain-containing protein [Anaerolineae bacterium]|nr:DUF2029 domain-containing protein [Anaerolineae bacterium]
MHPSSPHADPPLRLTWRDLTLVVALVIALVCLALYIWPDYRPDLSTISQYAEHAQRMAVGQQPYRDFVFEYPPLAIPLFFLPGLGVSNSDVDRYRLQFALEQTALAVALGWLALALVRRYLHGRGLLGVLVALPLFLLAAGVMATLERYDLAPALVTLAAIYLWPHQQGQLAWPLLAIGTALKVYPALLAPLFALEHLRRGERRTLARNVGLYIVTLLLAFLPFLATGPAVLEVLFAYHGERGLEINSLWATPLLLRYTRGAPLEVVQAHASEEVVAPGADMLAALAVPAIVLLLGLVYWVYWRRLRAVEPATTSDDEDAIPRLLRFSALSILAFVLPNKVFSPQYLVWLIPLLPMLRDRQRWLVWGLFGFILALTQYVYPSHWVELTRFLDPRPIFALAARNILLLPLFVLLFEEDETHP